jgi:hypothetical protein
VTAVHPSELTINDYVDDALSAEERTAVEHHLQSCAECRLLADELGGVRRAAASLAPLEPPPGSWKRIERELREGATDSRQSIQAGPARVLHSGRFGRLQAMPWWSWAAAAAALAIATAVGLRLAPPRPGGAPSAASAGAPAASTPLAQSVERELLQAEEHYQKAISGMEQIASAEKGTLDPVTAATLEKNLAVIDQAIGESRAALKTQPNSEPAQQSLLDSFKTKLALLQETVALINEMRKGDDAGAARIVSGLKPRG